ncbi:MAG: hypothetical protein GY847_28700 [Proteobacteria bacterium]|nr:hypothetical protein [Pseudomonadota bacterium]
MSTWAEQGKTARERIGHAVGDGGNGPGQVDSSCGNLWAHSLFLQAMYYLARTGERRRRERTGVASAAEAVQRDYERAYARLLPISSLVEQFFGAQSQISEAQLVTTKENYVQADDVLFGQHRLLYIFLCDVQTRSA